MARVGRQWTRHVANLLFLLLCVSAFLLFASNDAAGQLARPSTFALDTATSIDQSRTFGGGNGAAGNGNVANAVAAGSSATDAPESDVSPIDDRTVVEAPDVTAVNPDEPRRDD